MTAGASRAGRASTMKIEVVILAAGQGTRMKSELPKVLVPVCGRPMIDYVLDVLLDLTVIQ